LVMLPQAAAGAGAQLATPHTHAASSDLGDAASAGGAGDWAQSAAVRAFRAAMQPTLHCPHRHGLAPA
jgi:hypothetical protein